MPKKNRPLKIEKVRQVITEPDIPSELILDYIKEQIEVLAPAVRSHIITMEEACARNIAVGRFEALQNLRQFVVDSVQNANKTLEALDEDDLDD